MLPLRVIASAWAPMRDDVEDAEHQEHDDARRGPDAGDGDRHDQDALRDRLGQGQGVRDPERRQPLETLGERRPDATRAAPRERARPRRPSDPAPGAARAVATSGVSSPRAARSRGTRSAVKRYFEAMMSAIAARASAPSGTRCCPPRGEALEILDGRRHRQVAARGQRVEERLLAVGGAAAADVASCATRDCWPRAARCAPRWRRRRRWRAEREARRGSRRARTSAPPSALPRRASSGGRHVDGAWTSWGTTRAASVR